MKNAKQIGPDGLSKPSGMSPEKTIVKDDRDAGVLRQFFQTAAEKDDGATL